MNNCLYRSVIFCRDRWDDPTLQAGLWSHTDKPTSDEILCEVPGGIWIPAGMFKFYRLNQPGIPPRSSFCMGWNWICLWQVITVPDFVSGSSDIIIPMSEMRHFIFLLELFGWHIKNFLLNRFVVFYQMSNHNSFRQNSFKFCLDLSMEIKYGWNLSKGTTVF